MKYFNIITAICASILALIGIGILLIRAWGKSRRERIKEAIEFFEKNPDIAHEFAKGKVFLPGRKE